MHKTSRLGLRIATGIAALSLPACASAPDDPVDETYDVAAARVRVMQRPYDVKEPTSYDAKKPTPLVILLHGYGANGVGQDVYFGLSQIASQRGFLLAYPDGTVDSGGKQFWNATDACCDFENKGIDDVGYLDAIITDMSDRYNVDKKRVYFVGHSNGGFMSYRMACDKSRRVAAIVSLAGANYADPDTSCKPERPVAVLQVHGDADATVPYAGGRSGPLAVPSAESSVGFFARKNGCATTAETPAQNLDLEGGVDGAETSIKRWPGCTAGTAAELWTMHGVGHIPNFNRPAWAEALWSFLAAHPQQ